MRSGVAIAWRAGRVWLVGGWTEARFLRLKRARKRGARVVDSEERVLERGGIGSSSVDGGAVVFGDEKNLGCVGGEVRFGI